MNPTNGSILTAEDIVNQHETAATKLLSNEQLQRVVLLQQANVLRLKRMKLEREMQMLASAGNNELFDWDGGINFLDF